VSIELRNEAPYLEAFLLAEHLGIDPRPCDDNHPECRNAPLRLWKCLDDPMQQMPADTGAANGHDADLLVIAVAELMPQPCPIGEVGWIETGHISREGVVLPCPVPDERQLRPERVRNGVGVVADEDRLVAYPREARDVFDHLRVVVGGQQHFAFTSIRHRKPADEVSQPNVGRPLLFRILV
jgi:hypothetical protein